MSSFNLTSVRSSSSPLRTDTTPQEHAIAHEVLLVAILTDLARAKGCPSALIELRQTVESIIGKSHPNSFRIASDLINEAAENFQR